LQAADHLLYLYNSGHAVEQYKRFYFQDIQAFIIQHNRSRLYWNLALFVLFALAGQFVLWTEDGVLVFWGLVAAVWAALLIVNTLRGPTCTCRLVTSVSNQVIHSLNRVRTAEKVLLEISPFLEAAQGTLPDTRLQATRLEAAYRDVPSHAAAPDRAPDTSLRKEPGTYHLACAGLLLGDALLTGLGFALQHIALVIFMIVWTAVLFLVLMVALVRQPRSRLSPDIKRWAWVVFSYLLISYFVHQVYGTVAMTRDLGSYDNQWEYMMNAALQSPMDSPFLLWSYLVSALVSGILGLAGLLLVLAHRRRSATPPKAVPPGDNPDPGQPA
jgi:hypothetical protein